MNFGGRKPILLVFFADAVPTEDEIELVADMPGNVQTQTRNASAVAEGEKPEKGDFVIAVSDDIIPSNYADYPRFDKGSAKKITDEQKRQRIEARKAMQDGLTANNGVEPQLPQSGVPRPQIIPGSEAKPDLDAIHGKNQPKPAGEKLGGFPGTAKDGETARTPQGGSGGDPATPAPDGGTPAPGGGTPWTGTPAATK